MYEEGPNGPFKPVVRDVQVYDLQVRKCRSAVSIRGYKESPVSDVGLLRCTFEQAAQPNVLENVEGVVLRDVTINGKAV